LYLELSELFIQICNRIFDSLNSTDNEFSWLKVEEILEDLANLLPPLSILFEKEPITIKRELAVMFIRIYSFAVLSFILSIFNAYVFICFTSPHFVLFKNTHFVKAVFLIDGTFLLFVGFEY